MCVRGLGFRCGRGYGRPCPPMRGDIVTVLYIRKLAQVDVCSSICLRDNNHNVVRVFAIFSENYINFGRRLLLNKSSYKSQLWLILKRCVCSLK